MPTRRPYPAIVPDIHTSVSAHATEPPESIYNAKEGETSVFQDLKIKLSSDLDISEHLRSTLVDIIQSKKGKVVENIDEAGVLVCQYREGSDFRTAGSSGKTIGNLPWLYHLITRNSWTSPMRRLLHYPIAREGLPGFNKYRISLSNYNGEARVYLENLAKAAGCEFTKTMKMDNTHLITAHTVSEKCEAAREWNIHMINHLWLEESYAKWMIQSVAKPRYTHFPERTNLGEVVGQTPIDKKALEDHFFPKATKPVQKTNAVPNTSKKSNPVDAVQQDATSAVIEPSSPVLAHRVKEIQAIAPATTTPTPTTSRKGKKSVSANDIKTPAHPKIAAAGKENETPSTGSRSAKQKAFANMQGYASDFALYEKEKKRTGGVVYGGRSNQEPVKDRPAKRTASVESDDDVETSHSAKKAKRSKKVTSSPTINLLVTGFSRWGQDNKIYTKDKVRDHIIIAFTANIVQAQLHQLGINLTDDHVNCSYLAAPKILRTKKFICAMAQGPVLLSTEFVEKCLEENRVVDMENYTLKDNEGEKRYHMSLPKALKKAKANKGNLLKGQSIYVADGVHGGYDTYQAVIEANGGKSILYKGRKSLAVSSRPEDEGPDDDDEYIYLVSGTTAPQSKLWPKFRSMAESVGKLPRIVKTDWLLDLALSQEIRWEERYELSEDNMAET
jgi:hypothetical protein